MSISMRRGMAQVGATLVLLAMPGLVLAEDAASAVVMGPANAIPVPVMQATYSVPEPVASNVPWYQHIQAAAKAHGVDAHLLQAVMKVESNFDPYVVSRAGAIGLMQIMPATAAGFIGLRGTKQSLSQQLMDPAINVHAGALYLRSLMDTFSQRVDLARPG